MSAADVRAGDDSAAVDDGIGAELAALTLELCRIPSETRSEAEIATWVQRRCTAATEGAAVKRIGNSVVCDPCAGARDHLPAIALVGHLDTVKCAEDQEYTVRGGRVYGCGSSDMKAGVAVMLALLDRCRELGGFRPVWIFYDAEEGPAEENGLQPVLDSGVLPKLDFAFILEPTDMGLQPGCMGTMHATVTVAGTRAHSARPWQGENAVYHAIPVLERFAALERKAVSFGDLTFYEVMVVTQVLTANSKNVVPDAVTLNVNVRFAPGHTAEEAEAELRALVGDLAQVEITDCAPSGDVHVDHPLIRGWLEREKLAVRPKQAWTDVARFTSNGIAAVNFGPGETGQAHQANEWASIESLEFCYRALRRFFTA